MARSFVRCRPQGTAGLLSGQSSQRFQASYEGDEWQAFEHLNRANRAPFSAFFVYMIWRHIEPSPERFIQLLENGHIPDAPDQRHVPDGLTIRRRSSAGAETDQLNERSRWKIYDRRFDAQRYWPVTVR